MSGAHVRAITPTIPFKENLIMSTEPSIPNSPLSQMVKEAQGGLETKIQETANKASIVAMGEKVRQLITPSQYVGELFYITYDEATVKVHDIHRRLAGGVPSMAFLLATRLAATEEPTINVSDEDACFILLRVVDAATLPDDSESIRTRADAAAEVSGSEKEHWDQGAGMDAYTSHQLGYAGLKCSVLGTFFFTSANSTGELSLEMGTDIDNFYPNKGLKVYKPIGEQLSAIVNYYKRGMITDPVLEPYANLEVVIGSVRYSSTDRRTIRGEPMAYFRIRPADMIAQKTAFFGMTRTGKSNTVKVLVRSIHELRQKPIKDTPPLRVGQIIFDPNGEYGNANDVQASLAKFGEADSMYIYSLGSQSIGQKNRRSLRFDFAAEDNLDLGKGILNGVLIQSQSGKLQYATAFQSVYFEQKPTQPVGGGGEEWVLYNAWRRKVEIYRAILRRAGFSKDTRTPSIKNLFPLELRKAMCDAGFPQTEGNLKSEPAPTWDQFNQGLDDLFTFATGTGKGKKAEESPWGVFEREYMEKHQRRWMDDDTRNLLHFASFRSGVNQIRKAAIFHKDGQNNDYANEIYGLLCDGALVIVDLSLGNPEAAVSVSERIAGVIFARNNAKFADGAKDLPNIIIYAEEAHRLLPPGSEQDTENVWAAIAKEGAKFRIGLAYSTQEPSSIQKGIIKATYNFFISHLNNADEMKEIGKYYDISDFTRSILRSQDRGFVRVKTLSNPFTVPVQINKFEG
jgi:hypothetical protein